MLIRSETFNFQATIAATLRQIRVLAHVIQVISNSLFGEFFFSLRENEKEEATRVQETKGRKKTTRISTLMATRGGK